MKIGFLSVCWDDNQACFLALALLIRSFGFEVSYLIGTENQEGFAIFSHRLVY